MYSLESVKNCLFIQLVLSNLWRPKFVDTYLPLYGKRENMLYERTPDNVVTRTRVYCMSKKSPSRECKSGEWGGVEKILSPVSGPLPTLSCEGVLGVSLTVVLVRWETTSLE